MATWSTCFAFAKSTPISGDMSLSTTGDNRPPAHSDGPLGRLETQRQARRFLVGPEATCGCVIRRSDGWVGAISCKKPTCYRCVGSRLDAARKTLSAALSEALDAGLLVLFITVAPPHHRSESFETVLRRLDQIRSATWGNGKWVHRAKGKFGSIAQWWALETDWSLASGWHPHLHSVVFFDGVDSLAPASYVEALKDRIALLDIHSGSRVLDPSTAVHAVQVSGTPDTLAGYLTKGSLSFLKATYEGILGGLKSARALAHKQRWNEFKKGLEERRTMGGTQRLIQVVKDAAEIRRASGNCTATSSTNQERGRMSASAGGLRCVVAPAPALARLARATLALAAARTAAASAPETGPVNTGRRRPKAGSPASVMRAAVRASVSGAAAGLVRVLRLRR